MYPRPVTNSGRSGHTQKMPKKGDKRLPGRFDRDDRNLAITLDHGVFNLVKALEPVKLAYGRVMETRCR